MIWCRSAASADKLDSGRCEFSRIARHVFRRTEIDIASFHRARHAGIRLRGQGQGSRGSHPLDRVQHGDRSHAAVDAEHVNVPLRQAGGEGLRVGTVEAVAVFVDRDLSDDRNLRVHVAAREHSLMQFFEVSEGFEHEQVNATLDQAPQPAHEMRFEPLQTKSCPAAQCGRPAAQSIRPPRHRNSWPLPEPRERPRG